MSFEFACRHLYFIRRCHKTNEMDCDVVSFLFLHEISVKHLITENGMPDGEKERQRLCLMRVVNALAFVCIQDVYIYYEKFRTRCTRSSFFFCHQFFHLFVAFRSHTASKKKICHFKMMINFQ